MSKLSFISTNMTMDFLFRSGLPSLASGFELQKILEPPAKIICLVLLTSTFLTNFEAPPKYLLVQF